MRYAYCKEDFRFREYCMWIPQSLLLSVDYADISNEACLLYAYLLHAQIMIGKTDKKGHRYLKYPMQAIMRITKRKEQEAKQLLDELAEGSGCGLLRIEEEGNDLLLYAKDYTRPILPPRAARLRGRA